MAVSIVVMNPQRPPTAPATLSAPSPLTARPMWQRLLWLSAGLLSFITGLIGIFLPLLPTTPFILLAAFCLARGSSRCERWLLNHRLFGPMVHNWRAYHAIPLRAKQLAWVMMVIGSAWAGWVLPLRWAWLPASFCAVVAFWMWRLPSRPALVADNRSPPA